MRSFLFFFSTVIAIFAIEVQGFQSVSSPVPKETRLKLEIESAARDLVKLEQVREAIRADVTQASVRERELQDQIARAEQELQSGDVFANSLDDLRASLTARRVELMIGLAGLKARNDSLIKFREAWRQESQNQLSRLSELERKELELAELKLSRAKKMREGGSVSENEVREAEIEVLRLQQRPLKDNPNIQQSANLMEKQLQDVILEIVDKSAQLKTVEEILQKSVNAGTIVADLRRLQDELDQLRKARLQGWAKALEDYETLTANHKSAILSLKLDLERAAEEHEEEKD